MPGRSGESSTCGTDTATVGGTTRVASCIAQKGIGTMSIKRSERAMQTDDATTGGLTEAIETLLPALERFLQFTVPERTVS